MGKVFFVDNSRKYDPLIYKSDMPLTDEELNEDLNDELIEDSDAKD